MGLGSVVVKIQDFRVGVAGSIPGSAKFLIDNSPGRHDSFLPHSNESLFGWESKPSPVFFFTNLGAEMNMP